MTHMFRRMSAICLAALLTMALLAGCGSSTGEPKKTDAVPTSSGGAEAEAVTLKVWGFGYTATTEDCKAISEAISEITRDKIGVNVDIYMGGDGEKLNLAMNSGEEWDLVNYHSYPGGLTAMVNTGLVIPIDDLVEQYAQEAVQVIGEEYVSLGKVAGNLYSLPNRTQITANAYGLFMRGDILDELGLTLDNVKTYDDMYEILMKVKEAYPDMYPVVSTWAGGGMQKAFAWDNLGTGFWDGLGILENCHDGSTKVVNMFETESYVNFVNTMYKWKQAGLLMPDGATSTDSDLIPNGKGFAMFNNFSEEINDAEVKNGLSWGHDCAIWQIVDPFVVSDAGGNSMVIPASSTHPEKAMQLWNLMFTDPQINELLCNGIEGTHYEYTDDTHQFIRRIEGNTWDYDYYWGWPDGKTQPLVEGTDPEINARMDAVFATADGSPAMGFKFDSAKVMNEITACSNVCAKYETALRWGELDPAEALPMFNKELYDAGLQNIIDEKQRQLDDFLGGN